LNNKFSIFFWSLFINHHRFIKSVVVRFFLIDKTSSFIALLPGKKIVSRKYSLFIVTTEN